MFTLPVSMRRKQETGDALLNVPMPILAMYADPSWWSTMGRRTLTLELLCLAWKSLRKCLNRKISFWIVCSAVRLGVQGWFWGIAVDELIERRDKEIWLCWPWQFQCFVEQSLTFETQTLIRCFINGKKETFNQQ